MIKPARRPVRIGSVVCTLGAAALLALGSSSAQAGSASPTSLLGLNHCTVSTTSQPFARWLDYADYELVPGGEFESPAWNLTGGAKLASGSEPFAVTGSPGASSLSLPAGSSATSPTTCVDTTYPSIRFFVAGTGSVSVSIVNGNSVIPAGVVAAGGAWAPTPVVPTSAPALGASSGGSTQVSVTFSGVSGNPQVDDVFVDPWSRG